MQKWEYCTIGPIGNSFAPHNPHLYFLNVEGYQDDNLSGDNEAKKTAMTIAKLGEDGWEMVGCGSCKGGARSPYHMLYFKRPII